MCPTGFCSTPLRTTFCHVNVRQYNTHQISHVKIQHKHHLVSLWEAQKGRRSQDLRLPSQLLPALPICLHPRGHMTCGWQCCDAGHLEVKDLHEQGRWKWIAPAKLSNFLAWENYLYINTYIYILYMGMSQNEGSIPGCLSRGYDSWVWFRVWFVGMIRGYDSRTLIKCFPTYFMYGYLPTLNPKMIHLLVIIPYMERFGAGMLLPLCMLLSECCVCALERACWCPWSAAARCWCRVLLAVRYTVWSGHAGGAQGAAAGSAWGRCFKGLLSEWRACFKPCFWSGHAGERMCVEGAACGCCQASLLVLLQGRYTM